MPVNCEATCPQTLHIKTNYIIYLFNSHVLVAPYGNTSRTVESCEAWSLYAVWLQCLRNHYALVHFTSYIDSDVRCARLHCPCACLCTRDCSISLQRDVLWRSVSLSSMVETIVVNQQFIIARNIGCGTFCAAPTPALLTPSPVYSNGQATSQPSSFWNTW